jgi:hypothetical protein
LIKHNIKKEHRSNSDECIFNAKTGRCNVTKATPKKVVKEAPKKVAPKKVVKAASKKAVKAAP